MSSMDSQSVLELWDAEDQVAFNEALETLLSENEWKLPLGDFCEAGVPGDWAEFSVENSIEKESQIISEVMVYFNESIGTGCPDINFKDKRRGKLIVTIDKKTGVGTIESSQDYERFNPEEY